jgi:hypothetical protein
MNLVSTAAQDTETLEPTTGPQGGGAQFWVAFAVLTVTYAVAAFLEGHKFVWFDELCTFYIARAPSLTTLWHWTLKYDNNPPTVYLLARLSMKIFGPGALGLRLPSILEFYAGSMGMLLYLRRKVGTPIAVFGVAMLWASGTFYYAIEARVYALVFMSFSFLLLSWDTATRSQSRKLALFGVAASNAVLLSAHVFAPLCLYPFLAAEVVRYLRRRKPDYPLYAALVLPMAIMALYIPLILVYRGLMFWPTYRASLHRAGDFYFVAWDWVARPLCVILLLAIVWPRLRPARNKGSRFVPEDWAVFLCIMINPLLLNLVLMTRHASFFDRYTISTYGVIYGGLAVLIGLRLQFRPAMAYAAALIMLFVLVRYAHRNWVARPRSDDQVGLATLRPDLPIVAGDGMTFIEMSYHEPLDVLRRLYYIKNRAAAIQYEHSNYFYDFEAPDDMQRAGFPISGTVEPYSEFVASHPRFLIYADPWEWLPRKLQDDGATFTLLRDFAGENFSEPGTISFPNPAVSTGTPYLETHIFLVTMPPKK